VTILKSKSKIVIFLSQSAPVITIFGMSLLQFIFAAIARLNDYYFCYYCCSYVSWQMLQPTTFGMIKQVNWLNRLQHEKMLIQVQQVHKIVMFSEFILGYYQGE